MPIPTPLDRAIHELENAYVRDVDTLARDTSSYTVFRAERERLRAMRDYRIAGLRDSYQNAPQHMPTLVELCESRLQAYGLNAPVETNTVEYRGTPVTFDMPTFDMRALAPMPIDFGNIEARVIAADEARHLPMSVTAEPVSEDDSEETESTTAECIICGETHDRDVMEYVIDMHGDKELASSDCISEADDYLSPDYMTYSERRAGITYFHVDQIRSTSAGTTATTSFADSNWFYSDDGDYYESYGDSPEGIEEREAEERSDGDMYDYDRDVLDVHGWPEATPVEALCFGVELECESRNEDANELCTALGGRDGDGSQYILKSDGSIDYGTEIVTLPYTLEYHQARFNWAKVLAPVQDIANSGAGTTQCGIHVHINRAAVSALTLGKMLVFVNDPRNVRAITGVAQRSESSWSKFQAKKLTDGIRGKNYDQERYQALNVKDNTIEVRIFRGNLRAERVLKNLEFCHALVMYCRHASMQHLTWEQFWTWLRSTPANRRAYGNLIDFAHSIIDKPVDGSTDKDI